MTKRPELRDDVEQLVDEWKSNANNNGTRVVNDVLEAADDAVDATNVEDPREALEVLLEAYGDVADGYDPDEANVVLTEDQIQRMCGGWREPPAINPNHVQASERVRKLGTDVSSGLVAAVAKYEFDDEELRDFVASNDSDVEEIVDKMLRSYAGKRSAVEIDDVRDRLDISAEGGDKDGSDGVDDGSVFVEDVTNKDAVETLRAGLSVATLQARDELYQLRFSAEVPALLDELESLSEDSIEIEGIGPAEFDVVKSALEAMLDVEKSRSGTVDDIWRADSVDELMGWYLQRMDPDWADAPGFVARVRATLETVVEDGDVMDVEVGEVDVSELVDAYVAKFDGETCEVVEDGVRCQYPVGDDADEHLCNDHQRAVDSGRRFRRAEEVDGEE